MSDVKGHDTSYEWKIILLLSLTFGLVGLDRFVLPIILQSPNSTMAADLGLTPRDGGTLAGYLGMAWGISAFVMGYMADRVGRRAVLVPAILVFSVMSAASGMVGSLMGLIMVRIIMGVAEGPVASTGVAVAVEASKPSRRGMNNGIFQCMISLFGLALAPFIATRLLETHSWQTVFMLVGAPGVIVAVIMWFVVREPLKRADTGHGGGGTPFLSMFGHRNAKVAPLTLICAMGGIFVIAALLQAYLTAPVGAGLGLDAVTAGTVFTAVGVGGCIGQFSMPTLSDFVGRKVCTLASYILAAVFLYFFTQAGADNITKLWVLLFFASLFNFAALAILAGPVAAEAAPPGMLASMAGFVIFAGEFVGGGLAPIIAGNIAGGEHGLKGALYFAASGLVLGFFVALFLKETAPRRVANKVSTLPINVDDRIVWDSWLSLFHFPVVSVADEVGTFAAITAQSRDTDSLASELGLDARALAVHLALLASLGFVERREGRWRATAATRTWLHPQADGYAGPLLHRFKERQPFHAQLLETLRTGKKAAEYASVAAEWERGEMPPDLARMITAFMNAHSRASSMAVGQQPLFAGLRSVLDVGGGSGIFAIEMAKAWPDLKATVLEIGTICTEADGYIAAAGIGSRVKTHPLNMFTQPWPGGYDAHFFSNIFHDWSDETCRLLARKSFEALPAGGRILLHEILMDDDGCGPAAAAAFSLLMLIGTRGRQYSLSELRQFLEAAGFVDIEAVRTGGGYYSLVSARKA